ncbi:M23 family metallopeptidase [Flavobacterium davisii]|uniref:M23 family metallopeptidase n=1 Tax=Flavobacterium davisii TaxID=2906077 RepID=UPI0035CFEAAC
MGKTKVEHPKNNTETNCICKQYDLIWGNKVNCDFRKKVVQICAELWGESKKIEMANGLMAVMAVESAETFSASKIGLVSYIDENGKRKRKYQGISKENILKLNENFSGPVGLIQFTEDAIKALNKENSLILTKRKLALMTNIEQLDYVKKYFELYKWHKKIKSPEDIYLQVFAPIGIGKQPDYVLYEEYLFPITKKEKASDKAYKSNESVDTKDGNNDDKIQRKEILKRYEDSKTNGEKEKENDFACGKIKKEETISNSLWHNPLDNSQRTYYNSNGVIKSSNGAFGPVRTKIVNGKILPKNHQGLDLFADIGTPCKACLNGNIVSYTNEGNDGYGNVLVLEVNGEELRKAKKEYKLEFVNEKEKGDGFDLDADKFYLRYAHLKSAVKTKGEVMAGETIAYTGDSGNAKGVPNPHLHFEIAMKKNNNGKGLTNRCNPTCFVRLEPIDMKLQKKIKDKR